MRVAIYADLEYAADAEAVYAREAFALFAAALRDHVDTVVLVGRLDSDARTAGLDRLRSDVEFVALPHYPSLARPWRAAIAGVRSVRTFNRVLGEVDAVWLLGPHPLALMFAVMSRVRRRRVVLGVREDLPTYVRLRRPGRHDLQLAACALEAAWRALAAGRPAAVVGEELERRYRAARPLLGLTVSLVRAADVAEPHGRSPDRDERRVLSVGRLDPEKNPLLLADVLARLREHGGRWRLLVCGAGSLAGELASRLRELGVATDAELLGHVDRERLRTLYASSDALLHVSWTEGVPQVLLEAFAAGLPVVATDVGGVRRAAGEAALLAPAGDASAAADALRRVVHDDALRTRLVRAGTINARAHTLEAETGRLAALLADRGQTAAASAAACRYGWSLAVLPPSARVVDAGGDPALERLLAEAGFVTRDGMPDAVLLSASATGRRSVRAAARRLAPHGVVGAVAGRAAERPIVPVAWPVRAAQLLASPLEAAAARSRAARIARALRTSGMRTTVLASGDPRGSHALGSGWWRGRRRAPVRWIVIGAHNERPTSTIEAVVDAAGERLGAPLTATTTLVLESGKLLVHVAGPGGQPRYVVRMAAHPARAELDRSLQALEALAAADVGPRVRERIAWPLATGEIGAVRWSLEPHVAGRNPGRVDDRLWRDALDFLVELHCVRRDGWTMGARAAAEADRLARAVGGRLGPDAGAAVRRIAERVGERLADVPLGFAHGDFWNENLLVRGGRLSTVLDWDWASARALPALDLMDLVTLSARRTRHMPLGRRFVDVLWPLGREGGDRHIRDYCAATGVRLAGGTLEALAVAYWLDRLARDMRPFVERAAHAPWLDVNARAPLAELERSGW
jgi:glycosyltransferase involved in cell wall biosynthesis